MVIRGYNGNQYIESNPVIRNCIFTGNETNFSNNNISSGGAVFIIGSSPTFIDCEFNNNSSPGMGGAIYISSENGLHESKSVFEKLYVPK